MSGDDKEREQRSAFELACGRGETIEALRSALGEASEAGSLDAIYAIKVLNRNVDPDWRSGRRDPFVDCLRRMARSENRPDAPPSAAKDSATARELLRLLE